MAIAIPYITRRQRSNMNMKSAYKRFAQAVLAGRPSRRNCRNTFKLGRSKRIKLLRSIQAERGKVGFFKRCWRFLNRPVIRRQK